MSLDEVAAFALALPGVTEGTSYRNRSWTVSRKSFAWERPLTKADIKRLGGEAVPEGPLLAVAVADLGEKEAVLAEGHRGVFTIQHFSGYPAVLMQLDIATKKTIRELIIDAWSACAPQSLADEYRAASRRRL